MPDRRAKPPTGRILADPDGRLLYRGAAAGRGQRRFLRMVLSDFDYEGETVMLAPASGFYSDPACGRNEVRIAYVLKKEDLERALVVLGKALEAYNNRK